LTSPTRNSTPRRRRLWLERFCGNLGPDPPGIFTISKTKSWLLLDCDPNSYEAAMEQFGKDCDEQILERLLGLNLERAAEENQSREAEEAKGNTREERG
jgi:hypothetical protein